MRYTPSSLRGFTLVELLAVMAVIAMLAGMVLAASQYVMENARRRRAEAEIGWLAAGLESYKADNGDYPRGLASTGGSEADSLDPRAVKNPAGYKAASLVLYTALSGDYSLKRRLTDGAKRYVEEIKGSMLIPKTSNSEPVVAMVDPWGNPYGYSTAYNALIAAGGVEFASHPGYNPTFDLWSTADDLTGKEIKWVKNW